MKIPADALISTSKLTDYLLKPQAKNDKSQFLAAAGFTQDNPDTLVAAIRRLTEKNEAVIQKSNQFGTFYQVDGRLLGTNNRSLSVRTVWIRQAESEPFRFVTLLPLKGVTDET